jgi:hypothetical protein
MSGLHSDSKYPVSGQVAIPEEPPMLDTVLPNPGTVDPQPKAKATRRCLACMAQAANSKLACNTKKVSTETIKCSVVHPDADPAGSEIICKLGPDP